ncbi:DUF3043 domain-containing protein [Homoserinimonas hongtaonis]|uniref:DUF3043 domain-containing protein n=1 Tax=Homoserinimonas hongtaonis TaxID=2079791 RepID=A0A2U1SY69_9MICO|nr:DUF3043 domain-containing protein [Salinibacterium hongtaonis]AWB89128.1 DUF3043 domain-containing protein [Salinibacterium hongtaonis]PWB96575.1 DUF3043 domain-containing protein [Salinibacterium hongtaonis]
MAKPARDIEPDSELTTDNAPGKGRPTPTRKEREAANQRPLVSNDRKTANREAKAKYNEARDRARVGMANGEEKYLPARDKGAQRKYVRDYVDARFSIGELMIPVMLLIIVMSFVADPLIGIVSVFVLWAFFLLAVLDCIVAGWLVTRRLTAKFGTVQKGTRWYCAMRCLQMRPMRLPKPQVKRREFPA